MSLSETAVSQGHPDIQRVIVEETQKQRFQHIAHSLTDICWEICMGNPSSHLDSKTEKCFVNCVERHKYKFIFGGIAIGGVVLISDYARRVLKESQERETKEILERNKKHQHYEGIEEICNKTALTAAMTLNGRIADKLTAKYILNRLKSDPSNKIQLWEQLMCLSFTKVVTLVYASSLVLILLRVQLNLIGGYLFRDSADRTKKIDTITQDKYLSMYNNLFDNGIQQLIQLIKQKVNTVLKNKSLKNEMTVQDIEKIFWSIQTSIDRDARDPCKAVTKYCLLETYKLSLPEQCLHNHNGGLFDDIVEETRDILESSEIRALAQCAVVSGFAFVMDEFSDYFIKKCNSLKKNQKNNSNVMVASTSSDFSSPSSDGKSDEFADLTKVTLPMARIIPLINELVPDNYVCNSFADKLMVKLIAIHSIKAMGANVYEAFSTNF